MVAKIIIDVILCLIMGAGVFIGVKFGFVKIASKPAKVIIALIIAFSLAAVVGENIVTPIIDAPVTNYVSDFLYENCGDVTADNAKDELPTLLKFAAGAAGIDISEAVGEGEVIKNLVDKLIDPLIGMISGIFAFFGLLFISKLVLTVGFWAVDLFFKDGVLGKINKVMGIVFCTLLSIMTAWTIAVLIEFIIHTSFFDQNGAVAQFEGGIFYRFFNNYNPIEVLLSF